MSENTTQCIMDIEEIRSILPHRYPFLLVDKVIGLVPGESVTAIKNVTANEPFFTGHFPQKMVMPGVLIVEAMAQAGALAVLQLPEFKGKLALLAAVNKAKFRKTVVPGDCLTLKMEIIKLKSSAGIGLGSAWVDGKKAAEAEITFMFGS